MIFVFLIVIVNSNGIDIILAFDELYCECGNAVKMPPIACGEKPPECKKPCTREHPCDHPANHNCHSDPVCTPCTVLVKKLC